MKRAFVFELTVIVLIAFFFFPFLVFPKEKTIALKFHGVSSC